MGKSKPHIKNPGCGYAGRLNGKTSMEKHCFSKNEQHRKRRHRHKLIAAAHPGTAQHEDQRDHPGKIRSWLPVMRKCTRKLMPASKGQKQYRRCEYPAARLNHECRQSNPHNSCYNPCNQTLHLIYFYSSRQSVVHASHNPAMPQQSRLV